MTFCSIFSVEASSKTGHKEFSNITFLYDESAKLLIKMSPKPKKSKQPKPSPVLWQQNYLARQLK